MFIPRGTEHTFQVCVPDECEHLVILTPGGFEQIFADMAKGQFRIPEVMEGINVYSRRTASTERWSRWHGAARAIAEKQHESTKRKQEPTVTWP